MKKALLYFLVLAVWGFAGFHAYQYHRAPEIYVSYSTKKCIKLVSYKGEYLPCSESEKYKKKIWVWVK